MIQAGTPAPGFKLRDQDGETVSLDDFAGRRVLLVFYPADFSPACTDQLSTYEAHLPALAERGVEVLGISVDSSWCHRAFRSDRRLTTRLLADFHPKGEVARAYGLWSEEYGVALRALVLVGADGVVEWAHRSPSPLEVPEPKLILEAVDARP